MTAPFPSLRLKLRFLPAIPGTNAAANAAAAQAAAAQAEAAAAQAVAATANKVNKSGDVMTGFLTLNANPTANLHAATKQYVDSTAGGAGTVSTSGPVTATQLAGFADATGTLIRAVGAGTGLDMSAGNVLNLDQDLASIANVTAINAFFYRSAPGIWQPVTIGANLTFAGGTLAATGGGGGSGNVTAVGTPTNLQFARWTTATSIEGISPATALTAIGAQPLDGDLTALAALTTTNAFFYRSAADTWAPVLIGANMTFTGGTLSSTGAGGGGGNVSNVGTPTPGQFARWTTATTIEGVDGSALGLAPIASPAFTGNPTAPTPTAGDNDTTISTTAFVTGAIATSAATRQPVDGDLTAISNLTGTNTIYYRSATDTWSPVTFSGLTFTGGVLTSIAGGGDVLLAANNVFTGLNTIPVLIGNTEHRFNVANTGDVLGIAPGAAGTNNVALTASGADAVVAINYTSKGTGTHSFFTHGGGTAQLVIADTAANDRSVQITGGTAGTPPSIRASTGALTILDAALTGSPTAPTASPGDNDTSIATTAFVAAAVAAGGGGGSKQAFTAHPSANQTGIASETFTKITFNTVVTNEGSFFNTSTSRYTPPSGKCQITASVGFLTGLLQGTPIRIAVFKNGTAYKQSGNAAVSNVEGYANITIIDACNGTDFYEIFVACFTGTTASTSAGPLLTYFQGTTA